MRILIINQHFHIGGVETFLLSLIKYLMNSGHEITVCILDTKIHNVLLPDLKATGAKVISISQLKIAAVRDYDIAFATNPNSFIETTMLFKHNIIVAKKLVVGVYQTKMFCLDRGPFNLHNKIINTIFNKMPINNVIFGNHACRTEHAKKFHLLNNSPVVPLIVDGEKFPRRIAGEQGNVLKIISIGRLDHFKTYNLTMLSVLKKIKAAGINMVWHVYGSGPLKSKMAEIADVLDINDMICFHGDIEYKKIPEILTSAFAFVGSGLSMMEAAASGVPAIPAIEYSQSADTYGFVHEIEGISFFEPNLELPRLNIGDKLIALTKLSQSEYEVICDLSRKKMTPFFSDRIANEYLRSFKNAATKKPEVSYYDYISFKLSAAVHIFIAATLRKLKLL